jgi:hypothetical protein
LNTLKWAFYTSRLYNLDVLNEYSEEKSLKCVLVFENNS